MAARSRRSAPDTAAYGPYSAYVSEEPYADDLVPGERIGLPLSRSRGRAARRTVLALLIALGGGWAWLGLGVPADWPSWQSIEATVTSWVNPGVNPGEPARTPPAALALAAAPPAARTEAPAQPATDPAPPPLPAAARPAPSLTTGSLPTTATSSSEYTPAPLPPPADLADPYRKRAAAVGLHPDLSRVLLARLSSTDYRNAGIAIETAVAETPDTGVFVWPRQRKPELALFQVHFVQGAAPGCRRYVVSITKDGWLTTALPMEKCGTQRVVRRRD